MPGTCSLKTCRDCFKMQETSLLSANEVTHMSNWKIIYTGNHKFKKQNLINRIRAYMKYSK